MEARKEPQKVTILPQLATPIAPNKPFSIPSIILEEVDIWLARVIIEILLHPLKVTWRKKVSYKVMH